MAFSIAEYIKQGFKNVPEDPQSIKEAALAVRDNWKGLGNTRPRDWASTALSAFSAYEKNKDKRPEFAQKKLELAYRWITGAAQPTAAKHVLDKAQAAQQDISKKIANLQSNIANVLDFAPTTTAEEKQKLQAKADAMQTELAGLQGTAQTLGVTLPAAPVKTATGYIPASEVGGVGVPGGPAPATITEGAVTAASTGYKSAVLPEGFNTIGLTDSEVKAVEEAYLKSQGDQDLVTKVMNLQDITQDDVQGFLTKASEEQNPYYKQVFTRASEDFTRSLDYQAKQRELQVAQEKLQAAKTLEQEQVGMAEAGLATSGIRQKAEAELAKQAQDIAMSSRRQFEYGMTSAGRQAEDVLGSAKVASLKLPEIAGAPVYQPLGGVRGSLEREQETNRQLRADQLQAEEQQRRAETLASFGNTTTL